MYRSYWGYSILSSSRAYTGDMNEVLSSIPKLLGIWRPFELSGVCWGHDYVFSFLALWFVFVLRGRALICDGVVCGGVDPTPSIV